MQVLVRVLQLVVRSMAVLLLLPPCFEARRVARSGGEASEGPTSAHCDLCADNWLFILAAGGRTGSTTAMSMFDAVPGFEIAGEHFGILLSEMHQFRELEKAAKDEGAAFQHHPPDFHALRCAVQQKIRAVVLGKEAGQLQGSTRVLGFKEIRYTRLPALHFISLAFPCARYVFPYRANPGAEKSWAQGFGESYAKEWVRSGEVVRKVHQEFPNTTALLAVEELTHRDYNNILGDVLGVSGCRFKSVLHDNPDHGYTMLKHIKMRNTAEVIEGDCDLSNVDFNLSPETLEQNRQKWEMLLSEA